MFRHRGCSPSAFTGLPTVYCDADASKIGEKYFGVRQNPEAVVVRAVNELLARDFSDYAFVHYRTRREWTLERESVFLREMKSRGKSTHVFRSWDRPYTNSDSAFGAHLVDFILSLPRPCGILAANDEMAAHVLGAARMAGISVPEEMTVVGIDNDELVCENTRPTLSSVAPAFLRSGRLAAGLLARCVKHRDTKPTIIGFGADPFERRLSTRKTARADIRIAKAMEYIRTNACKGISAIDAIREILAENLDIAPESVTEESTFESLNIDSLDMVELICGLEDMLDIDFGEPEGLMNVGDVVHYIDAL